MTHPTSDLDLDRLRHDDGPLELPVLPPDVVAAHRATWTAALRSGSYPQAREELRTADGYCCLGVAEDVRGARWRHVDGDDDLVVVTTGVTASFCVRNQRVRVVDASGYPGLGSDELEHAGLTGRTQWWLGLAAPDPVVAYRDADTGRWVARGLISLNDDDRLSLAEIADTVDDQPADWDGTRASAQRDAARRNADIDRTTTTTTTTTTEETT